MEAAKTMVSGDIPVERISPVPASKSSPNTKLDKACQFCEYKKSCWPNLRMFEYSYGIEYLVHVEKPPRFQRLQMARTAKAKVDLDRTKSETRWKHF